jgi:hypothetical protein
MVLLLAGKIDPGRFIDEAKARYGEKIETFLTLGMAQDDTQGVEKPGFLVCRWLAERSET